MGYATVNGNGQVTINADLRKRFDIHSGEVVEMIGVKEGVLIRPVAIVRKDKLNVLREATARKNVSREELLKACRQVRQEAYEEEFG